MSNFTKIDIGQNYGTALYRDQGKDTWLNELLEFIREILITRITENEDEIDLLLGDDVLDYWIKAFTHKSWNPNVGENYERLEKIGDNAMDLAYDDFLLANYPNITESAMGESNNFFMAKVEQAKISVEIGLGKWVLTNVSDNMNIDEDLLEAFFGAIFMASVNSAHLGPEKAYGFVDLLFRSIYEPKMAENNFGDPPRNSISEIKEIFEKMGWAISNFASEIEEFGRVDNNNVYNLKLTPIALEWFKEFLPADRFAIIQETPYFGSASNRNKKVAKQQAYNQGYAILNAIIPPEFIEVKKKLTEETNNLYASALSKVRAEGYIDIEPKRYKGTSMDTIQLLGIRKDGAPPNTHIKKDVLITMTARNDTPIQDFTEAAYSEYLNS